jgi:hypothetical protein
MVGTDLIRNAISLNSMVVNVARIAGPAVAAALIGLGGLSLCFAVNAVSYVAVLVMLALVRARSMQPADLVQRRPKQLRAGIAYLVSERDLLIPFVLVAISGLFAWEFQITLPWPSTPSPRHSCRSDLFRLCADVSWRYGQPRGPDRQPWADRSWDGSDSSSEHDGRWPLAVCQPSPDAWSSA